MDMDGDSFLSRAYTTVQAMGYPPNMSVEEIVVAYNEAREVIAAAAAAEEEVANFPVDPAIVDNTPLVQDTANLDINMGLGIDQPLFNDTPLVQDTANTDIEALVADINAWLDQPLPNTSAPVAEPQPQGVTFLPWGNTFDAPLGAPAVAAAAPAFGGPLNNRPCILPPSAFGAVYAHQWYVPPGITEADINDNTIDAVDAEAPTYANPEGVCDDCLWDTDTFEGMVPPPRPAEPGMLRWVWDQRHGHLFCSPSDRDQEHTFHYGYHMAEGYLLIHELQVECEVDRRVKVEGQLNSNGGLKTKKVKKRGGSWKRLDRPATSMEYRAWRREMVANISSGLRSRDGARVAEARARMRELINWGVLPCNLQDDPHVLDEQVLAGIGAKLRTTPI